METPPDFLPTADLTTLRLRAKLLAAVRRFFDGRGYFEVDTPLLSHDRVVDPHLEPFVVQDRHTRLYLQTSPEFAMKRLLVAGARAIYQVGHVFRAGESGRLHNPEFTMAEWYRASDTHHDQMQVIEELVVELFRDASAAFEPPLAGSWQRAAGFIPAGSALAAATDETQPCAPARGPGPSQSRESKGASAERTSAGINPKARAALTQLPFLRTTYQQAFTKHAGCDPFALSIEQLAAIARERRLAPPPSLGPDDRDGWLNLLLAELVEPHLGRERPEFVYDYPPTQAALARIRPGNPPVAERFELYIQGIEICNGYHELTDAAELRRRIELESQRRIAEGHSPLPVSNRLLAAMDAGLPPCSGVALGFDRLVMLALGAKSIAEVIAFPFERA
jgi:lysyl-tRNA synthetase class 2